MKFYFYSKINAYLKLNGKYAGRVSKNVNVIDYEESSDCLFEFLPVNSEYLPCYGTAGSEKISAYDFLGGVLIYPEYEKKRNLTYGVLDFYRFLVGGGEVYVKTYFDGGIMYDIDGARFIRGELPFKPQKAEAHDLYGFTAFAFTGEKHCVIVYSNASGNAVYKDVLDEYRFDGSEFTGVKRVNNATIPFVLYEKYSVDEPFALLSRETEFLKSPFTVNENLTDFAFLDLILKKADVSRFLHPDLKAKSNELYSFLGGIKGAFSIPLDGKTQTAVIENDKISFVSFEKSNSLITNIVLT